MINNQITHNTAKKGWLNPQLTVITASQIKGYAPNAALQNAGALTLDANALLEPGIYWPVQNTNAVPQQPVVATAANIKKAPQISMGRFIGYCVLMVIMLPLFIFTGRRAAN
jgi:hypothetical protein